MCHISNLARLNKAQAESSSLTAGRGIKLYGVDLGGGGMQGVRAIPLTFWDEAFSFVFAFKICLPHQSVTPFVDGAPLLRNPLDPPLLYMYFWQKNNFQGIIYYGKNYYSSEQIKNILSYVTPADLSNYRMLLSTRE